MFPFAISRNNLAISPQAIYQQVCSRYPYFLRQRCLIALVSEQGENIRDYARYLQVRVQAWRELKFDFASQNSNGDQNGRLKKLDVEKGLLREVEGVSRLVGALLKCKVINSLRICLI
jgi:hypothetical protein